ncbi:hypothetical protein BFL38_09990 [Brachyspira hampsonii]|uniref:Uncharacterized protein n=1 Tax=Brachyspira hampsonii TaxID=1287055 RepID=A0A1E5NI03_9SPIR|nr:hypothetical protein [Brachyspira hampsonii]OEJ15783.1 hypothetical protein BFL38_09990 [Brachyspira hampsonii]
MMREDIIENIKNKIITIDNINRINDCYICYLFSDIGNEKKGEDMAVLLKENTIFDEVKAKSESFIHNEPLIDTYRKKEIDEYFQKEMMNIELIKAEEKGGKNKAIFIAKNLKRAGLDNKFISEATGLSLDEIEYL